MYGSDAKHDQRAEPCDTSFRVASRDTVQITVYDDARTVRGQGEGQVMLTLPPGLYRVHLERAAAVRKVIVDHERVTDLEFEAPTLRSPVPFFAATTTHPRYVDAVLALNEAVTAPPLAATSAASSRLVIFVRRPAPAERVESLPSEAISIRDRDGRLLTKLTSATARIDHDNGYLAFAARVAPGTYRLRNEHSQRDFAVTIPAQYTGYVFLVDTGRVPLEELRVALWPIDTRFDPANPLWEIMECVIAALQTHGRGLPAAARSLLPSAADQDLCFAIAAAHLLRRRDDHPALRELLMRLKRFADLPDVALLRTVVPRPWRPGWRHIGNALHRIAAARVKVPDAPPLLRTSMIAALTQPNGEPPRVANTSALAQAARRHLKDSIWCTWSARTWDERWILPTIDRLRGEARYHNAAAIARRLALPKQSVQAVLDELQQAAPRAKRRDALDLFVPGYSLDALLGRGIRSTVFAATRLADRCPVAVKIVALRGAATCAQAVAALAACERIRDPRILDCNDFGRLPHNAGVWLELERCAGSALDVVAAADAPLPAADVLRIGRDTVLALFELYSNGFTHGNIKPGNLLLRSAGSIALADRTYTSDVSSSSPLGGDRVDPRFVAPEILGGNPRPLHTADMWALAATLYFLLTLEPPREEFAGQTAFAATTNAVVPIRARAPAVPAALAEWIDRALEAPADANPISALANLMQLARVPEMPGAATSIAAPPFVQPPGPRFREATVRISGRADSLLEFWLQNVAQEHTIGGAGTRDGLLQLPLGSEPRQIHVVVREVRGERTVAFGLGHDGPFYSSGIAWEGSAGKALFLILEISSGIACITCDTLSLSPPHMDRQYLCIPPDGQDHRMKIELRSPETAHDIGISPPHSSALTHVQDDGWVQGTFLELPPGGVPRTVYVKSLSSHGRVAVGFALHEAGPFYHGGISWQSDGRPLFVVFELLDGIMQVGCAGLHHSSPCEQRQYMCIPEGKATYELVVEFGRKPAIGQTGNEQLIFDDAQLWIVVRPVSDHSDGGGGALGVGLYGGIPLPTRW